MLFKETNAVCDENRIKHVSIKCSVTDFESRGYTYLTLGLKELKLKRSKLLTKCVRNKQMTKETH
jgi:hypothetical protein